MIRILMTGMLAFALMGCHHGSGGGSVTIESGGHHVHDHSCGHFWDGHGWLFVERHAHRSGCGHYYHNSQWHLQPAHHVYRDSSHGHFGITIERRRDEKSTPANPPRAHEEKPQPPGHGSPPKPEPHKPEPHKPKKPK